MAKPLTSYAFKLGLYGVVMLLLFSEAFVFAWCRNHCVQIGYALSETRKEKKRLIEDQEALRVELAHLRSPARIIKISEERLGLSMPRPEQVVVLDHDDGN